MKKILLGSLLIIATSTVALAQPGPGGGEGGFFKNLFGEKKEGRKEFREERREDRKDFRDEMHDAREGLREDIKARKEWMASTTASGTAPTPWKDFRKEVKDARKDFMQDRKEDVKKFIGAGFLQNATATAVLAQRLGTTTEALKQMAASGTLHMFMKNKVGSDDVMKFVPKNILGTSTISWATNTPITVTFSQNGNVVSTTTTPSFWNKVFRFWR